MRTRQYSQDTRTHAGQKILATCLAVYLAACASKPLTQAPRNEVIGSNARYMIVLAREGDSYAALADRYLGMSTLGWRIAEFNKYVPVVAAKPVIVPREDFNTTGITQSGVQRVPILCYHRFTSGNSRDRLEVSDGQFEEQIIFLKKNGYTVVSMADFDAFIRGKKQLPRKSVVITIDDGYRSIYNVAYPIIQRHRIPVTAYIYTDFIGSGAALTWAQVKDMSRSGLVDIQSHTKSHSKLSERGKSETASAYAARIDAELETSRAAIAKQIGMPVVYLAYPYGGTNASIADKAGVAGYANATTVIRGVNAAFAPRHLLRRDMVFGTDSLALFARRLGAPVESIAK